MPLTPLILEEELALLKALLVGILSDPPPGGLKVKNIYVNDDGKIVVEYEDE